MTLNPHLFLFHRDRYLALLTRLDALFKEMDRAYAAIAQRYGFQCNGCPDNCCLTRFYHHTLLEYLYLLEGVYALEKGIRQAIYRRAREANTLAAAGDNRQPVLRIMCPLNRQGRCRLYRHRPMICRLHGIPFQLNRPDGKHVKQPGCDAFFDQCRQHGRTDYIPFDRTPFYRQMALLEKDLRALTGYAGKIKLTIAQMLATFTDGDNEID